MRLKLTIAYDGRPYSGWQSQACGNTVQDILLRALEQVAKIPLKLHGSGRTDTLPEPYALVHAILAKATAWQVVPDDLQARAAAQWGKPGLVEIVVLSGFYQMFAAINQAFDIRPGK